MKFSVVQLQAVLWYRLTKIYKRPPKTFEWKTLPLFLNLKNDVIGKEEVT